MKVWGLSEITVINALGAIGLDFVNGKTVGKVVQGRIAPRNSRDLYSRSTPEGRRVKACCFHGFRDGIMALFVAGATRVQSTLGDYRTSEAFRADLDRLAQSNIGSPMYPCSMIELCDCGNSQSGLRSEYAKVDGAIFDPESIGVTS